MRQPMKRKQVKVVESEAGRRSVATPRPIEAMRLIANHYNKGIESWDDDGSMGQAVNVVARFVEEQSRAVNSYDADQAEIARLKTSHDALLAAVKDVLEYFEANRDDLYCRVRSRRLKSAIKQAEGGV